MEKTRVLIVEDQAMPRQLFEMFINQSEKYALTSSISSADMAIFYCEQQHPDLVIMDVCTSLGASGLDATQKIKRKFPSIKVIVVTSMPEYTFLNRAKQAGADSFWYKEISKEPILELMDRTMAGEHIFPESSPVLSVGYALSTDFTPKELEILRLLMDSLTDQEIADRMGVSAGTVHQRIVNIMNKTGFNKRGKLITEIQKSGFILTDY